MSLRLLLGLPRVALHLVVGMLLIAAWFPLIDVAGRERVVRWWSRRLLAICGVTVASFGPRTTDVRRAAAIRAVFSGPDAVRPGALLIANHISWLDIFVVHSLRPARFVAKSEIARWPVVGYLTARTGTLFIERGKRHAVREANQRAARLLADGALIGMFPEGTTGDGDRLLAFHANLLQPAIDAKALVIAVGLRYLDRDGTRTVATSYVGDTSLFESMIRILRSPPLTAEVHLIDAIDPVGSTRHDIGRRARALIAATLDFDDDDEEAAEGRSTVIVVPDPEPLRRAPARRGTAPAEALDPRDELL